MTSQCRACLSRDSSEFIHLGLDFTAEETYFDCFNKCTQLQTSWDDDLPKVICATCHTLLQTVHDFIKMAEKSDGVLRSAIKEADTVKQNKTFQNSNEENMIVVVLETLNEEVSKENVLNDWPNETQQIENNTPNCQLCKIFFETQTQLEQHLLDEHSGVDKEEGFIALVTCEICQKFFESTEVLNLHMLILHSNNSDIFCVLCNEPNKASFKDIKEHLQLAHPNEYTQIFESIDECSTIDQNEFDENCPNVDTDIVDAENDAISIDNMKQFVESQENQKKTFSCSICSHLFKNRKSLRRHEKIHYEAKNQDAVYDCADCDRQYSTLTLLDQHRKNTHKLREFSCNICGNAFKLKNQLKNHMKLHLEKNISCPYCDKKYARRFDLNVHLRSHTGELPYECHLCDKKFAIKVRLTYHLQKHSGIKHKCKECGAEFNSRTKLKAHTFKHTGMPYRCELCYDHGFPNRDVFKRHLLRVHNATITEEDLVDMFQRNTGKTARVRSVNAV